MVKAVELSPSTAADDAPLPSSAPLPPAPAPYYPSVYYPCVEVPPAPELPGDPYAVRTASCGGYLLVLDAQTGRWRAHR